MAYWNKLKGWPGVYGTISFTPEEHNGFPDDQVVICGLALGHADPDAVPNNLITERAPLGDFTTWFEE